jgi:hypothetical protein
MCERLKKQGLQQNIYLYVHLYPFLIRTLLVASQSNSGPVVPSEVDPEAAPIHEIAKFSVVLVRTNHSRFCCSVCDEKVQSTTLTLTGLRVAITLKLGTGITLIERFCLT